MYLQEVTIRGVKCFDDIKIDFRNPDGSIRLWNVIIGENGTGKTTLLQAIAVALLGEKAVSVLLPRPTGWIRSGTQKGEIEATIIQGNFDIETAWEETVAGKRLGMPIEVSYEILRNSDDQLGGSGPTIHERTGVDRDRLSYPRSSNPHGWFAAGYGPFRRLGGGSEQSSQIAQFTTREARFITLFREDAALTASVQWLTDIDYASRDDTDIERQEESKILRNIVFDALNNYLLPKEVRLDTINSQGVFFSTPYASKVPLFELSDGYRAILAMSLDLLSQLSQSYKSFLMLKEWRKHLSGVILIDELDAHLHPIWQREIGFWLKKCFPGLQFIVATHSPFMPQVADDYGLFTLRHINGNHFISVEQEEVSVQGWRADQILSILFNTPSMYEPETEIKLRDYSRLKILADMNRLNNGERQDYEELKIWFNTYIAPQGDTRTEMMESRALDQRISQVGKLLRERKPDDKG